MTSIHPAAGLAAATVRGILSESGVGRMITNWPARQCRATRGASTRSRLIPGPVSLVSRTRAIGSRYGGIAVLRQGRKARQAGPKEMGRPPRRQEPLQKSLPNADA
jgi:hypothetical protein